MSSSHRARRAWMSLCLVPSAIFFLQVEKWRILRNSAFASNSVSNWGGGEFAEIFSDVATGLWRGLFEPYPMSRWVPAFRIVWDLSLHYHGDHPKFIICGTLAIKSAILTEKPWRKSVTSGNKNPTEPFSNIKRIQKNNWKIIWEERKNIIFLMIFVLKEMSRAELMKISSHLIHF